jgi:immunoglobulin-like protein involved in spore germination
LLVGVIVRTEHRGDENGQIRPRLAMPAYAAQREMAMKRALILVGMLSLLATSCAEDGGGSNGAAEPGTPATTTLDPSPSSVPAIVVETPQPGDVVSNPVTIAGEADVFEATVSIRILGEAGDVVAEDFTTATCGTGCRGTYSTEIAYEVDSEQPGTIEVFESSAEDGSQLFLVSVPVTLVP